MKKKTVAPPKEPQTQLQKTVKEISEAIANPKLDRVMFIAFLKNEDGSGNVQTSAYVSNTDGCWMLARLAKAIPE